MTRRVAILLAVWTVASVGLAVLVPAGFLVPREPGCWVTAGHGPECDSQLAALNARVWWGETVPLILVIAAGYVVIAILAIRAKRSSGGR